LANKVFLIWVDLEIIVNININILSYLFSKVFAKYYQQNWVLKASRFG